MKPIWTVILLTLIPFSGCGLDGSGVVLNEAVPSNGMLLYQGSFPGAGVTGTAQIYSVSGQIVVRFAGLQTPTDTRYYFFLEKSTAPIVAYSAQLRGPVGSQNYYTGLSAGPTWTRIAFRATSNSSAPEISQTTLTVVTP